jgi:hypothetical protein
MLTGLGCSFHNQEPLDLVCLTNNCDKKGLICYLCKITDHNEHSPIVSLKMFIHSFLKSRASSEYFVRLTAQIDEELLLILQKLTKIKNKFQEYVIVE